MEVKPKSRFALQGIFRPEALNLFKGGYRRSHFGADLGAGISVGLTALPLALALGIASIPAGAETPFPAPAIGLFTAIIGGFIISALGGTRAQIGGPTAAFIPIVLLIVERHGFGGLLVATIMAGIILVVMGLAKMGTLIKFIPWPVVSGFTTGIAVSIMMSQYSDAFGVETENSPPRLFTEKLYWMVDNAGLINPATLLLTAITLVLILVWPRLKIRHAPGPIVMMLLATVVVAFLGLGESLGIATIGSKYGAGAIPSGFPPFTVPTVSMDLIRDLLGPAMAIALLGAIESLLSAVVADGMTNDRHDSNTELIGQGIANIVCPFFVGLPVTGAIARTSANVSNGARSPVSGMIHALTLLLIVLFLSDYAVYVPVGAMSAVLIAVALRMGGWRDFRRLREMPAGDAVVLVTTFGLTVVFDLVVAIEVGMVLAAILFIRRVSETTEVTQVTSDDVLESPEQQAQGKEIPKGVMAYRIFGPFLFGAAQKMEDALLRSGRMLPKVLILRLHLVTAMDATALHALETVVGRMKGKGGTVIISGIHRQPLSLLKQANFIDVIGRKNFCGTFDAALERARELL